jgi:diacylglycerol kinase (ATP)
MSSLPLIIVNPASAGGHTRRSWASTASDLGTHFGAFNCEFTNKRGDARRIALREALGGRRLIVACGGDGTISDVANGILESDREVALGILPSGTGGDFRRTLGISTRTAEAARVLKCGRTKLMDVGRITYLNHEGVEESRYFLGVASFGLSGEVIERVKANRPGWLPKGSANWLSGKLLYAVAMLQTTISSEHTEVWVQLDERTERRLKLANLCVANARYFGGGMKIAPEAKMNDGQFDVITIGDLSATKILANAYKLYAGTHLGIEHVYQSSAKRVTARPVEKNLRVAIEVDGELPGHLPASCEILPGALRVRCP